VAAAVVAIYFRSASGYFFEDDVHWMHQTFAFSLPGLVDLSRYSHFYRPVIEGYFFAGLTLFGCNPLGFHVTSIAIHLLATGALYGFASALARSPWFGLLSAALFAVQPGFTDAVTWIAAITDLLPGLWYILALWAHLRFVRERRARDFILTLAAFALCHLTHESAATLLPMMLVTELTFGATGSVRERVGHVWLRAASYAPFALLLAGYLVLAYVVNTRSYLVQDGHYAFGWHAIPHIIDYIVTLYVGKRGWTDYLFVCLVAGLVAWKGTPRARYGLAWIVVTLLPVSFFTWGNAPRYLYLPAAGFAMLLAELLLGGHRMAARRMSPHAATAVVALVAVAFGARFGVFAKKAADSFPSRALVYARLAEEVRRSEANPDGTVVVDQRFFEGVPDLYRQPAVSVALCRADVRLRMR
jgi:hypothetical protein